MSRTHWKGMDFQEVPAQGFPGGVIRWRCVRRFAVQPGLHDDLMEVPVPFEEERSGGERCRLSGQHGQRGPFPPGAVALVAGGELDGNIAYRSGRTKETAIHPSANTANVPVLPLPGV